MHTAERIAEDFVRLLPLLTPLHSCSLPRYDFSIPPDGLDRFAPGGGGGGGGDVQGGYGGEGGGGRGDWGAVSQSQSPDRLLLSRDFLAACDAPAPLPPPRTVKKKDKKAVPMGSAVKMEMERRA